jgi:hypothetical protein
MTNRFRGSEGIYLFVLGLVVMAVSADHFWLGFTVALIPILIGAGVARLTSHRLGALVLHQPPIACNP